MCLIRGRLAPRAPRRRSGTSVAIRIGPEADMVTKLKSLLPSAAIAGALFLGAPAPKANAQVAFQAQFATPIGTFGVGTAPGPYYAGRPGYPYYGHGRPYYAGHRYGRRPYWLKRVYVRAPYPRWIYQRVYSPYPYAYTPPCGYYR
jgi:hypothetical protein